MKAIVLRTNRVIVGENRFRLVGKGIMNISAREDFIYLEMTCEQ